MLKSDRKDIGARNIISRRNDPLPPGTVTEESKKHRWQIGIALRCKRSPSGKVVRFHHDAHMKRNSLRCPVSREIQSVLEVDPWMKTCLLHDETCVGRIEWQHAFTYAGTRRSELYTLIPLCSSHHRRQAQYRRQQEEAIRLRIEHFNAEEDFRKKYPRSNIL